MLWTPPPAPPYFKILVRTLYASEQVGGWGVGWCGGVVGCGVVVWCGGWCGVLGGVVWCGVVWCGVVWCGGWCGVVGGVLDSATAQAASAYLCSPTCIHTPAPTHVKSGTCCKENCCLVWSQTFGKFCLKDGVLAVW